ncbi:MAG: hypothetical protein J5936_00640, partial [Acholeplasmatales bacterium]|nr:hypothetical protein [Acholeplasmatales bacterium]
MLLLFVLLVLWAAFTCMFYFLIDLSNWYLFLWVPAGLLVALAVEVLILYLYLLLIGQHTKNEEHIKHI